MRQRFGAPLVLAALAAMATPAAAQTNFSTYVSIGDSLAAGFNSGGLAETHQRNSVPAHIARQAGVSDFQQPLVSFPGIPPVNRLQSLVPGPVIGPVSATPGRPLNLTLARPYNNLAVPGATSIDALSRVTDSGGLHDLILRGLGTQVAQAKALRPTFVTVWIGNNDVLGAAIRGTAVPGVTLTPTPIFRQTYAAIISELRGTGAFVVAANLPDVTAIPYVTTIRPFLADPVTGLPILVGGNRIPILGSTGPLPENAYVTLAASSLLAQGIGIPTAAGGRGTPLPDEVVLTPAEVQIIRDHVSANNQAIREICAAADVPVVDLNGVFSDIAVNGRNYGGVRVTSAFLTGGLFSYDGVHPTDLGYAIAANEWISVINDAGGNLEFVDVAQYTGLTAASNRRGMPEYSAETYHQLLESFPEVSAR